MTLSWQLLVSVRLGCAGWSDAVEWAAEKLDRNPDDIEKNSLLELVALREEPDLARFGVKALERIVRHHHPEFSFDAPETEAFAKDIWLQRLRTYVEGELRPIAVCSLVPQLEEMFDFPIWLGQMHDA